MSCRLFLIFIGTRWKRISGRLKQVESGPNGALWGVNRYNNIYFRAGITRRNPVGRYWVHVKGRLSHITIGCSGAFGVDRLHRIWRYKGRVYFMATWNYVSFTSRYHLIVAFEVFDAHNLYDVIIRWTKKTTLNFKPHVSNLSFLVFLVF